MQKKKNRLCGEKLRRKGACGLGKKECMGPRNLGKKTEPERGSAAYKLKSKHGKKPEKDYSGGCLIK